MWLSDPFPHAVFDGLFDVELLDRVIEEFPATDDPRWQRFFNGNEQKLAGTPAMLSPAAVEYFEQLAGMSDWLSELTGIPELSMELIGGGYHLIPPGGRLAMHTDFNKSPKTGLFRRLNVLTYLNYGWTDEGGCLYLGANREVTVVPEYGRTAIFETSDVSWHGHPLPAERNRYSVAAYFFSPEQPAGYRADHSTVWLGE